MYLSKVHVPWSRAKNPYELHRALWQLFPDRPDDARNFLFRVDQQQKGIGSTLLMLSQGEPSDSASETRIIARKALQLSVVENQRIRFRLRANPIKAVKDHSKGTIEKNGKRYVRSARVPLVNESDLQSWLERKLETVASIEGLIIQKEEPIYFRKTKESRSGKIQTALYDGILVVQNKEKFIQLLANGIGPAKAFGCGMLSIAPA